MAAIIFLKVDSPKRFYADPAASLAISFIIFYSAIPMSMYLQFPPKEKHTLIFCLTAALKSGRILLEASPIHLDLGKVKEDLLSVCFSLLREVYVIKFKPTDS